MKHGKRADQPCGLLSKGGRTTCDPHDPERLAEAKAERDAVRAKREAESPGICQERLSSGRRRGLPCGGLMLPGRWVCHNHTEERRGSSRDVAREYHSRVGHGDSYSYLNDEPYPSTWGVRGVVGEPVPDKAEWEEELSGWIRDMDDLAEVMGVSDPDPWED